MNPFKVGDKVILKEGCESLGVDHNIVYYVDSIGKTGIRITGVLGYKSYYKFKKYKVNISTHEVDFKQIEEYIIRKNRAARSLYMRPQTFIFTQKELLQAEEIKNKMFKEMYNYNMNDVCSTNSAYLNNKEINKMKKSLYFVTRVCMKDDKCVQIKTIEVVALDEESAKIEAKVYENVPEGVKSENITIDVRELFDVKNF